MTINKLGLKIGVGIVLAFLVGGAGTYLIANQKATIEKNTLKNDKASLNAQVSTLQNQLTEVKKQLANTTTKTQQAIPAVFKPIVHDIKITNSADNSIATVYDNSNKIKDVQLNKAGQVESSLVIIKQTPLDVFLGTRLVGIGGYILYDTLPNKAVYRYDFQTSSFTQLQVPQISDVSVSEANMVYVKANSHTIVWADKDGNELKTFTVDSKYQQFGDIFISLNEQKIAYAAAIGNPDHESGAIFSIDIASGKQTQVTAIPSGVPHVNGWNSNDSPHWSVN